MTRLFCDRTGSNFRLKILLAFLSSFTKASLLTGSSSHPVSYLSLLCTALGSSSPSMPVIPIPRRVRSFHGPHTTCMHSACGSAHTSTLVRTKYNNFDLYLRSRCMYSFLRFLLYFGCSLLTSLLWVLLSALFFLQYVGVRVLLRLQYKLSVILLLLGHRRLDFGVLNDLIIYSMHITMFLVGGLGWCFMVFVDM
ncbi:hypothetical protein GOODEAATRI_027415 [Goodea atripinnis]|uniref:Transmembrane protein 250 n=1 Tax=Goodea atripinnis TaxID=208336 RepID=A0ABV0P883_9TELE